MIKLGTLTMEVYRQDAERLWYKPTIEYSEALQQMQALMSPQEKGAQSRIIAEVMTMVGGLFIYVENPDRLKAKQK